MSRWLIIAWGLFAVLGLGLWLGLVATAKSRAGLLAVVGVADPDRPAPGDREAAEDLLALEMAAVTPDPQVVASAWALLATGPGADGARTAIGRRSDTLLAGELGQQRPDAQRLHLAHDLAAVLGPESAAAVHARIAQNAGERSLAAAGLVIAAEELRRTGAALAVEHVASAWDALVHAGTGVDKLTWAARETPPVADSMAVAIDTLRQHLEEQLQAPERSSRDELRATWDCLKRIDQGGALPPELVARYATAVRNEELPVVGLSMALFISVVLFGGAALAYRRLARGVRTIDPGAETMEDIDAIDLDTDAITLQGNATSEETKVD